jgi:hypothetical protein
LNFFLITQLVLYCYITVFKVRITFDISIMKEEETTHPRNNSEIQLSNLRKRQNRCPDTQIHDCSLFCHGTGMSLMKGNMSRRMRLVGVNILEHRGLLGSKSWNKGACWG